MSSTLYQWAVEILIAITLTVMILLYVIHREIKYFNITRSPNGDTYDSKGNLIHSPAQTLEHNNNLANYHSELRDVSRSIRQLKTKLKEPTAQEGMGLHILNDIIGKNCELLMGNINVRRTSIEDRLNDNLISMYSSERNLMTKELNLIQSQAEAVERLNTKAFKLVTTLTTKD